jgi:hypothetical protein
VVADSFTVPPVSDDSPDNRVYQIAIGTMHIESLVIPVPGVEITAMIVDAPDKA